VVAGVMTFDLVKLETSQRALFDGFDRERSAALMGAMDAGNRRFGRGTVVPAGPTSSAGRPGQRVQHADAALYDAG
jgi:DNA polymerase V